ncbi:hypothetical protein BDQ17DRAFT_414660 [Cyathus striatus]|nr:hypothetical protein BDQ17DRAFT_414660 [Cyathus striatus]
MVKRKDWVMSDGGGKNGDWSDLLRDRTGGERKDIRQDDTYLKKIIYASYQRQPVVSHLLPFYFLLFIHTCYVGCHFPNFSSSYLIYRTVNFLTQRSASISISQFNCGEHKIILLLPNETDISCSHVDKLPKPSPSGTLHAHTSTHSRPPSISQNSQPKYRPPTQTLKCLFWPQKETRDRANGAYIR